MEGPKIYSQASLLVLSSLFDELQSCGDGEKAQPLKVGWYLFSCRESGHLMGHGYVSHATKDGI